MITVSNDSFAFAPCNGQTTQFQFDSKEQLESFVQTALDKAGPRTHSRRLFLCKLNNFGLALNLKDEEIKGLDSDEYPITLTLHSADEMYNFAVAYNKANPVRRVTSKGKKEKAESAILSFSKKEKLIGGIVAFAVIAGVFIFSKAPSKKNSIQQEAFYEEAAVSAVVGTWKTKFEESYTSPNSYAILYEYVTFNSNGTGKCDFTLETPGIISNQSKGFGFKWRMNGAKIEVLLDDNPDWETGYYYKGGSSITDIDGRSFEKTLR